MHQSCYPTYSEIYTDGSKTSNHVGCAFAYNSIIHSFKLHPSCSIFTAEVLAILQALDFIAHRSHSHFIIYTDSISVLESLQSGNTSHPLIANVVTHYLRLRRRGFHILFSWVPAHVGIRGNELADTAAKSASITLAHPVPLSDLKHTAKAFVMNLWQSEWDSQTNNKLHHIKPTICHWNILHLRKLDVIVTRLRIGHTRVTHRHLLLGEAHPICYHCNCTLTIKHILTECTGLVHFYNKYFGTTDLQLSSLVGEIPHPALFNFLHGTGFFSLI